MNDEFDSLEQASLIVAHDESNAYDAVVPPIVQTSLFTFTDYDDMIASYRGEKVRPIYTRGLNPTVRMFEEMLAKLERAEDALGFASGMSAISSTVLTFVQPGDRIVAVRHVYPDAYRLFGTLLKRLNVEVTYVDGRDEAEVARALSRPSPSIGSFWGCRAKSMSPFRRPICISSTRRARRSGVDAIAAHQRRVSVADADAVNTLWGRKTRQPFCRPIPCVATETLVNTG
jgi:hypothetical protein